MDTSRRREQLRVLAAAGVVHRPDDDAAVHSSAEYALTLPLFAEGSTSYTCIPGLEATASCQLYRFVRVRAFGAAGNERKKFYLLI
jgi:hypothetical protein